MMFDIQEFYPSITENVLQKSITFAEEFIQIKPEDIDIIFHSRKSLLYNKNEPWVKSKGREEFDVTMGSYDGAEVCELVGLFLLHLMSQKLKKENVGLYRDDGLAICKGKSKRTNENIKKCIIQIFKDNALNIEINCNLKSVDYLDVTFDLNDGTYKPFNKPNNSPTYLHVESNHPPSVIKQIPLSISKRISNNSSSKQILR